MKQAEKTSYIEGVEHRKCCRCHKPHPANEENFYWNSVLGVWSAYCRPCHKTYTNKYRLKKGAKKTNKYSHIVPPGIPLLPS